MSDDSEDLAERPTGVRARRVSAPGPWEPVLSLPAVSGDECVRALLAMGCCVDGFAGRAWTLEREGRRFAVPRHALLDGEVLLATLRCARAPLDAFIRTLERLDLLRGRQAPQQRPPASMQSTAIEDEDEREKLPLLSGDELAEALHACGWIIWDRTLLVLRLVRQGATLLIPRDGVLNRDFLLFLLERAGVSPAQLPELLRTKAIGARAANSPRPPDRA